MSTRVERCKRCEKVFSAEWLGAWLLGTKNASNRGFFCSEGCRNAAKRERLKKAREAAKAAASAL
jgi:hypothetical protein